MKDTLSYKNIARLLHNAKYRKNSPYYVAEGERWLEEVNKLGIEPIQVLASKQIKLLQKFDNVDFIAEGDLNKIAGTVTPSGVLLVLEKSESVLPEKLIRVLILDQLKDPGNLGTLIRSSLATSVDAIILAPGSVDPYNPKVVRSTMGAMLKIPLVQKTWDEIAKLKTSNNLQILGADMQGTNYTQVDLTKPSALVIGNEAHGLSTHAREVCDQIIAIPMANQVESLNAAVAGSIILFEAFRQHQ